MQKKKDADKPTSNDNKHSLPHLLTSVNAEKLGGRSCQFHQHSRNLPQQTNSRTCQPQRARGPIFEMKDQRQESQGNNTIATLMTEHRMQVAQGVAMYNRLRDIRELAKLVKNCTPWARPNDTYLPQVAPKNGRTSRSPDVTTLVATGGVALAAHGERSGAGTEANGRRKNIGPNELRSTDDTRRWSNSQSDHWDHVIQG